MLKRISLKPSIPGGISSLGSFHVQVPEDQHSIPVAARSHCQKVVGRLPVRCPELSEQPGLLGQDPLGGRLRSLEENRLEALWTQSIASSNFTPGEEPDLIFKHVDKLTSWRRSKGNCVKLKSCMIIIFIKCITKAKKGHGVGKVRVQ